MRHVAFVVPYLFETSLRFLRGALTLPGTAVSVISTEPIERFDRRVRDGLAGHWQVGDALDPTQLVTACRGLSRQRGPVQRLIGVLEQLQVPLAHARAALDLPGLDVETALNFRDKSRMKDVLRDAGVPCARHRLVEGPDAARAFLKEVGFPVVGKPPSGAGAVNTFRLDSSEQLEQALTTFPPRPGRPMLLEEFILGEEHSFDSVCVGGEVVWHSISRYRPTPLEVLHNQWIQWCVMLPRDIRGPEYDGIRKAGAQALRALGLINGLSHMEWFRRKDGSVAVSEVGARPPGAQITSLLGWAHDVDMHRAWARLMIEDVFDPPQRRWAVGAAYLRGQGKGRVQAVHGLEEAQRRWGHLVVEVKLPELGQSAATGYEGEGFVIVRHPETAVVAEALAGIVELIRVELR